MSDSQEPDNALPRPESLSDVRDILKGFKVLKSDPSDEVLQEKSAADSSPDDEDALEGGLGLPLVARWGSLHHVRNPHLGTAARAARSDRRMGT